MSTATLKYTRVAIALHWLIAIMIIGQIIGGVLMHKMGNSPTKFELYQLHKSFGLIVLILSFLRLAWRVTHKAPPLPDGMKPFERVGAVGAHYAFYVMMIGVPLVGWIMVSASPLNIPTQIFKTVPWPDFPGIPRSEALADQMKDLHKVMAFGIVFLLVLHIGAAMKHHFVNKDDVLTRMVPFLKQRS